MNKLVSIVTPCYNSEKYIADAIKSVLDQNYSNWEMIIVDDVSYDKSTDIIEKYANKDSRIRLIRMPKNSGAAVCRNRGIELAQGYYLAFLDSDDMWVPQKLAIQVEFMHANQYVLSFGSYKKMDEDGNKLPKSFVSALRKVSYQDLLSSNKIGCLTAMYDMNKLGKVYMPLIRKRQDYALWLKILKKTSFAYGIPQSLGYYRVRKSSISSSKIEMLKWNWKLFKEVEELSYLKSFYSVLQNVVNKIIR